MLRRLKCSDVLNDLIRLTAALKALCYFSPEPSRAISGLMRPSSRNFLFHSCAFVRGRAPVGTGYRLWLSPPSKLGRPRSAIPTLLRNEELSSHEDISGTNLEKISGSSLHLLHDTFKMLRLGKHIDEVHAFDTIPGAEQYHEIASHRGRIA